MSCEYCAKDTGNTMLMNGNPELWIERDEYDGYVLVGKSLQEDRWYGESVEIEEINYCPKCGEDLRIGGNQCNIC